MNKFSPGGGGEGVYKQLTVYMESCGQLLIVLSNKYRLHNCFYF